MCDRRDALSIGTLAKATARPFEGESRPFGKPQSTKQWTKACIMRVRCQSPDLRPGSASSWVEAAAAHDASNRGLWRHGRWFDQSAIRGCA